jgi:hypothetical protein
VRWYNAAMDPVQIRFFAERIIKGVFAAHDMYFAVGCFYLAWKIAPFWVAGIPAAIGLGFLFTGIVQVFNAIRA